MTFWQKADRFPPVLVRLLARHIKGRPLTVAEIAAASGLSAWQIESLSRLTTWTGVDLPTMRAFLSGCRLDFEDGRQMHRVTEYLRVRTTRAGHVKRPNFKYLRTSKDWTHTYGPLMGLYLSNLKP